MPYRIKLWLYSKPEEDRQLIQTPRVPKHLLYQGRKWDNACWHWALTRRPDRAARKGDRVPLWQNTKLLSLDRSQAKCLPFFVDEKGLMRLGFTSKVDSLFWAKNVWPCPKEQHGLRVLWVAGSTVEVNFICILNWERDSLCSPGCPGIHLCRPSWWWYQLGRL